jgi:hypothetical protein
MARIAPKLGGDVGDDAPDSIAAAIAADSK